MTKGVERAKVYQCPDCSNRYSRPSLLDQHRRSHTGERPYPCDKCDQKFTRRDHLERHQVVHTKELPLECTICGKKVALPHHLKQHMGLHLLRYQCSRDGCEEKFRTLNQLRRHELSHDLTCACGKSFSTKNKLAIHNNKYHGSHHCGACDYVAPSWQELRVHLRGDTCPGKVEARAQMEALKSEKLELQAAQKLARQAEKEARKLATEATKAQQAIDAQQQVKSRVIGRLTGTAYDDRPLACPVAGCERRFLRQYDLSRHLKAHHPERADPDSQTTINILTA